MKILKSLIKLVLGLSIIWFPILAGIIVNKLAQIITMGMFANTIMAIGIITFIISIKMLESEE